MILIMMIILYLILFYNISRHTRVPSGPSWKRGERHHLGPNNRIEEEIKGSEDGLLYTEYDENDGLPDWRDETKGNVNWQKVNYYFLTFYSPCLCLPFRFSLIYNYSLHICQ